MTTAAGPLPKRRFGHAALVVRKLTNKAGAWVNHPSEAAVGGLTPFTQTTRVLNGTTKFDDGSTIPAPPVATDVAAVKAWLELFKAQVQYD